MTGQKTASGLSPKSLGKSSSPNGTEPALALYARPGVKATGTELVLPEDLTFEEWEHVGHTIRHAAKAALWWWGDWLNFGERKYGETYAQALEASDYSYDGLKAAAWVSRQVEMVRRRTNLPWSHHREVAALEPDEQDRYLEAAATAEPQWTRQELRRAVRRGSLDPPTPPLTLPAGTFDVLLADPPWRYDFAETDSRAIENQYPTMDVEDIAALEVPVADNAVLFLWATAPKLREALEVMDAWGFDYRTHMIWLKDKIGMGYYARSKHELLLIGRRGDPGVPAESERPDSVFEGLRTEHSRKPEVAYELIETMYPERTYCELFARSERDGWTSWGNEL